MTSDRKFDRMLNKLETLVAWSNGTLKPWTGMAMLSPQDVADLAFLASYAPEHAITQFEKDMCLTNLDDMP